MKSLKKTLGIAVAASFVASAAAAGSVTLMLQDVSLRGDGVSVMLTNNTVRAIERLTLSLPGDAYFNQFNDGDGNRPIAFEEIDGVSVDPNIIRVRDADNNIESFTANFLRPEDNNSPVLPGQTLTGQLWVVQPGAPNGIRTIDFGENITASFVFEGGITETATSFFNGFPTDDSRAKITFEASPVPLPASAALLLGGLAGLGAMRRSKKNA